MSFQKYHLILHPFTLIFVLSFLTTFSFEFEKQSLYAPKDTALFFDHFEEFWQLSICGHRLILFEHLEKKSKKDYCARPKDHIIL